MPKTIIKKTGIIFFLFLTTLSFSNIYQRFNEIENLLKNNKTQDAKKILLEWIESKKEIEFQDKKIYLLGWTYYLEKDYLNAIQSFKKILLEYPKSSYYYPSLFFVIYLSSLTGEKENSRKMLDWASQRKGLNPENLFMIMVLRKFLFQEEEKNISHQLGFHILSLAWDIVTDKIPRHTDSMSFSEKQKEELAHIQAERQKLEEEKKQFQKIKEEWEKQKQITTTTKEEQTTTKIETEKKVETKKETQEEMDLKKLRQEILIKQKELEVLRLLLEEKKRLLFLKEEFLKQKENLEKEKQ